MALLKKFAGEAVIYGIGSVLPRVLLFALTPYLTKIFDKSEFGIHGIMYSFTALLLVFFTYGMETGLFRFGSQSNQLNKVFSTAAVSMLGTTVLFVAGLFFFSEQIAVFLEEPDAGRYVRWFALITGFDALAALPFARLRLENRPIKFASLKVLSVIINVGFIFFFLAGCPFLIDNGYEWFSNIYSAEKKLDLVFIANLIASAFIFLVLFKDFFNFKWEFDKALWRKMLNYSLPLIVVGIAAVINRQLDRIFLQKLLVNDATEQVGLYNAGVKVAVLMSLFITAFNYAAEPFFFKNANRDDSKPIYAKIAHAFSIVGSVAFLGIMLYIDIVKYLINEKFHDGLIVVPILLLAYFGLGLFYNFSIWYKLKDKTRIGAWISVGGAFITIIVNLIFIPKVGIIAPAYAALACYIFMAAVSYFIGKKYYPIDYPIGKMLLYISSAVLVFYVSKWIRPSLRGEVWKILLANTTLMLSYLGGLYFLENKEIKKLFSS